MTQQLTNYLDALADTVERIGLSVPFYPLETHYALICLEGHIHTLKQRVERGEVTEQNLASLQTNMTRIFGANFYTKRTTEFNPNFSPESQLTVQKLNVDL